MSFAAILVFAAVLAVAMATPGPAMMSLVARVVASGSRGGTPAFAAGLVLGDIFWFAAAVFGMAALASEAHAVMAVLKYLGAAYLAWLGLRLWMAPVDAPAAAAPPLRGSAWSALAGGFSLALANGKTMMFYLALLPSLVDLPRMRVETFLALTLLLAVVYSAVLAAYILGATRARRLLVSPAARRGVNRGSGAVMLGAAAFVATRS